MDIRRQLEMDVERYLTRQCGCRVRKVKITHVRRRPDADAEGDASDWRWMAAAIMHFDDGGVPVAISIKCRNTISDCVRYGLNSSYDETEPMTREDVMRHPMFDVNSRTTSRIRAELRQITRRADRAYSEKYSDPVRTSAGLEHITDKATNIYDRINITEPVETVRRKSDLPRVRRRRSVSSPVPDADKELLLRFEPKYMLGRCNKDPKASPEDQFLSRYSAAMRKWVDTHHKQLMVQSTPCRNKETGKKMTRFILVPRPRDRQIRYIDNQRRSRRDRRGKKKDE